MLHYLAGDILLTRAVAIAHGVAPRDHFDLGLALALRERWPAMVRDFRRYCHTGDPNAGDIRAWAAADGTWIVNLFTQQAPASRDQRPEPANETDVGHALHALAGFLAAEQIPSLALPRLASGVGKLSWDVVQPLIERHLGPVEIPVYVYASYHAGQAAREV